MSLSKVCKELSALNFSHQKISSILISSAVTFSKYSREVIRKKAVMAMLKFYMMDPEMAKEYISVFHSTLCDRDPTVMAATLNAYLVLIQVRAHAYRYLGGREGDTSPSLKRKRVFKHLALEIPKKGLK